MVELLTMLCAMSSSVVPMLVIGAFVLALVQYTSGQHEKALKQVAEHFGVEAKEGSFFGANAMATGTVDGAHLIVDTYSTGSGKNRSTWTRFRLRDGRSLPGTQIGSEGVFSFVGKAFKGRDIEVGDRRFDDKVLLRSTDELSLRAMLDADARGQVLTAVGKSWALQDGEWMSRLHGRVRDPHKMIRQIEAGLAAMQATRRPEGDPVEALTDIVHHDPDARVRASALRYRMTVRPPLPADDLRAMATDTGWVGLMAARALGEEGLPHLYEALEHGDPVDVRMQAAELLVESMGEHDIELDGVRKVFMQAVQHEPWIDRSIAGLAKVGTVEAVPLLAPHAEGFLPSQRKSNAQTAIRTIQSRIAGAGRGQVSIAQAQGGELSEVGSGERHPHAGQAARRQRE